MLQITQKNHDQQRKHRSALRALKNMNRNTDMSKNKKRPAEATGA